MSIGIRTEQLRKVYTSAPPSATPRGIAGAPFAWRSARTRRPKVEIVALEDLTLEVRPGEIFGLLGPNGAGKSTAVGVLTTRIRPTAGRAWVGEEEVWVRRVSVKRRIGVVPQRTNLDFSLTAREILTFHGAYFGIPATERNTRAQTLLERFQLADRADQLAVGFSGGMMQRLSIARAMMHEPEVLFLDEPSAGLDPQTRLLLWEIVRQYGARGNTIVLTTHNMEEADDLCARVAIVDHGKVIALGTPGDLKATIPGGYVIRLKFSPQTPELLESFGRVPGVTHVRALGTFGADVYADRGGPLVPELLERTLRAGAQVSDVHISEPSLENLFLHHTGRSLRD
ncbi:MAG: ABC transporter ATP-binding protein [Acidobacteriota bacterium]|nr:ABC transporter ATP-binding protein [Acidobacteriota bacterium]